MCDNTGAWQTTTTCSGTTPVCVGAACVSCSPTSMGCNGNIPQTCNSAGTWVAGTPCAQPTPNCSGGVCVGCQETLCSGICTTLNTTANCGACGNACNTTTGTPTCTGTTCEYTCNTGRADCNGTTPPDVDGCECSTPGCCGTGCQVTHSDGLGQSFYDCNPLSTYTVAEALEACTAYAKAQGGTAADCTDGWTCAQNNNLDSVCYTTDGGSTCATYCWYYSGSQEGWTTACSNCTGKVGSWN